LRRRSRTHGRATVRCPVGRRHRQSPRRAARQGAVLQAYKAAGRQPLMRRTSRSTSQPWGGAIVRDCGDRCCGETFEETDDERAAGVTKLISFFRIRGHATTGQRDGVPDATGENGKRLAVVDETAIGRRRWRRGPPGNRQRAFDNGVAPPRPPSARKVDPSSRRPHAFTTSRDSTGVGPQRFTATPPRCRHRPRLRLRPNRQHTPRRKERDGKPDVGTVPGSLGVGPVGRPAPITDAIAQAIQGSE
jgi:hypothetical protein